MIPCSPLVAHLQLVYAVLLVPGLLLASRLLALQLKLVLRGICRK
jgi:hypothetical protein